MTNFSIRAVVFLGICALATCVYGDLYGYSGYYAIGGTSQGQSFTISSSKNDPNNVDIGQDSGTENDDVISSANVEVIAGNGKIGVNAQAIMTVGPPASGPGSAFYKQGSAEAKGIVALSDTLTVNDGSPGSEVVVHAQLNLEGDSTPTVFGELPQGMPNDDRIDGSASISVDISGSWIAVSQGPNPHKLGDAGGAVAQAYAGGSSVMNSGSPPPSTIFLDETFVAGVPQLMGYTMTVDAFGTMQNYDDINKKTGSIFAVGGYGDTLSWGGITSITDTAGNPITGWTVTSASGFDYTQPAPEPAAFVLMAIALPGLLLAGRYRRS
jgi:hypothetical protein